MMEKKSNGLWELFFCSFLLSCLSHCAVVTAWEENELQELKEVGSVIQLTDATFKAAIGSHDFLLVAFYTPWCSHCKALKPELEAAAPLLAVSSPPIGVAKLDVEKYKEVGEQYKVDTYPTLLFFHKGEAQPYQGGRDAHVLVSNLRRLAAPLLSTLLSDDDVHNFIKKSGEDYAGVFVGFGVDKGVLEALAEANKGRLWFGISTGHSEDLLKSLGVRQVPALLAVHPAANESSPFYGPFEDADALSTYVTSYALPLLTPLDEATWLTLMADTRPIALAVLQGPPTAAGSAEFLQEVRAVAAPMRKRLVFAWINSQPPKYKGFLKAFGVDKGTVLPTLLVWDHVNRYWRSQKERDFSQPGGSSAMTTFVLDVLANKVPVSTTVNQSSLWDVFLGLISKDSFQVVVAMCLMACVMSWRNKGRKVLLPLKPGAMKEAQQRARMGEVGSTASSGAEEVAEGNNDKED